MTRRAVYEKKRNRRSPELLIRAGWVRSRKLSISLLRRRAVATIAERATSQYRHSYWHYAWIIQRTVHALNAYIILMPLIIYAIYKFLYHGTTFNRPWGRHHYRSSSTLPAPTPAFHYLYRYHFRMRLEARRLMSISSGCRLHARGFAAHTLWTFSHHRCRQCKNRIGDAGTEENKVYYTCKPLPHHCILCSITCRVLASCKCLSFALVFARQFSYCACRQIASSVTCQKHTGNLLLRDMPCEWCKSNASFIVTHFYINTMMKGIYRAIYFIGMHQSFDVEESTATPAARRVYLISLHLQLLVIRRSWQRTAFCHAATWGEKSACFWLCFLMPLASSSIVPLRHLLYIYYFTHDTYVLILLLYEDHCCQGLLIRRHATLKCAYRLKRYATPRPKH